MTPKESSLSDKIVDLTGGIEFLENTDFALDVEDVKEFIRALKEVLSQYPYLDHCYDCGTIFRLKKRIDTLAGPRLVEA